MYIPLKLRAVRPISAQKIEVMEAASVTSDTAHDLIARTKLRANNIPAVRSAAPSPV